MGIHHPHGFRPQVSALLRAEWPEAWRARLDLGGAPPAVGVRSRRATYERALRRAATAVDGLTVAVGRVDGLVERGGRVVGAAVDGAPVAADLVVDAGGRLSRLAPPEELGADTGMAYVTRTYRRHPGAGPGPTTGPSGWYAALRATTSTPSPTSRATSPL